MKTTREIAAEFGKENWQVVRTVRELLNSSVTGAVESMFTVPANGNRYPEFSVTGHMLDCVMATMEASMRWKTHVCVAMVVKNKHETNGTDRAEDDFTPALYQNENGKVVCTSLEIAERFHTDKDGNPVHKNVLAAIDSIECSDEFSRLNFQQSEYTNTRGRKYRMFEITRDGFAFLVMGFTGKKAARFKEKYIAAFNAMEKKLLEDRRNETPSVDFEKFKREMASLDTREMEAKDEIIEVRGSKIEKWMGLIQELELKEPEETPKIVGPTGDVGRNSEDYLDLIDDGFTTVLQREAIVLGINIRELLDILIKTEKCITNHGTESNPRYVVVHGADAVKKRYVMDVRISNLNGTESSHAEITPRGHKWLRRLIKSRDSFVENDIR